MGEVDRAGIDATQEEIAAQIAEDDAEAVRDVAAYARLVGRKLGLSQVAFAKRIGVPVDTVGDQNRASEGPEPAPPDHRELDRSFATVV